MTKSNLTITVQFAKGTKIGSENLHRTLRELLNRHPRVVNASVSLVPVPNSRSERLSDAEGRIASACEDVRGVGEELREWFDNLPEGLQGADKGDALQTAADELESIADEASDVASRISDVEVPGMYS